MVLCKSIIYPSLKLLHTARLIPAYKGQNGNGDKDHLFCGAVSVERHSERNSLRKQMAEEGHDTDLGSWDGAQNMHKEWLFTISNNPGTRANQLNDCTAG